MKNLSIVRSIVISAALCLPVPVAFAEMDHQAIEKLVSNLADSPENHKAIAEYYRAKAASAKQEIASHQSMKNVYVTHNPKFPGPPPNMKGHCENLITANEAAIKEYEAMAKAHEDAANAFVKSLPQ